MRRPSWVFAVGIRAATFENVPSVMCAQRRLKSDCASLQPDQSHRCPHEETLHPGYPKYTQGRFRSDCANAQSDLNLRWAHMSEGTFSDIAPV